MTKVTVLPVFAPGRSPLEEARPAIPRAVALGSPGPATHLPRFFLRRGTIVARAGRRGSRPAHGIHRRRRRGRRGNWFRILYPRSRLLLCLPSPFLPPLPSLSLRWLGFGRRLAALGMIPPPLLGIFWSTQVAVRAIDGISTPTRLPQPCTWAASPKRVLSRAYGRKVRETSTALRPLVVWLGFIIHPSGSRSLPRHLPKRVRDLRNKHQHSSPNMTWRT